METRNARAEIHPDGQIVISSATQAPFTIKKQISKYFGLQEGKITVKTPLVGGGFGGKTPVQLEILAYMASMAVGGRTVKITNTREEDIVTSPCRMGLDARIKLGAAKNGIIRAIEITYLVDTGAYADIGPRLAKAIAVDCTGPYNIENVWCDSYCVYTNHPYSTAFRGFGHESFTFCIERTLDKLASNLGLDPMEIRMLNAITPGKTTPTQVRTTLCNIGNLTACLNKLNSLINWSEGSRIELGNNKVRAKGLSCLWKTSDSPTDALSGVFLTFNTDGSINLNSGVVEYGPGMKTTLAQILAAKLKMGIDRIHVKLGVDTSVSPEHWKTVASMTTYMAGRATIRAAEDLIRQLRGLAAVVMASPPEDLDVAEEKVYLKHDPTIYVPFKQLVHGFKYPNGSTIEGQILGRGSFIMSHITDIDKETGIGKPGPAWTVGAQAVEVEYDTKEHTYTLTKAATVIDAGKVLNPKTARGLIIGGMSMGPLAYLQPWLMRCQMLSDSYVVIASDKIIKSVPIHEVFNERLQLSKGEFIVQFLIGKEYTTLPYVHVKKTKIEKIDYPLISLSAIRKDGQIRLALSGVCAFPFRSLPIEQCLNNKNMTFEERASCILDNLPAPVLSDLSGSDSYRKFVLRNTLINTLETLEAM